MQDMDYGMGTENMENAIPDSGQYGDGLFQPEHFDEENAAEEGGVPDEAQSSENGMEKPKRRRKKPEEKPPQGIPDDEQNYGSDAEPDEAGDEKPQSDEPGSLSPEGTDEITNPPRRRERGLDSYGRVIYDQGDRGQHDMSILTAARNARRILTTTIDGIDTDGNSLPRVVFYVGTVKVLIPFAEMGMDLNPKEIEPGEAARIIDSMLGAKIDYMVRGVNVKERLASGDAHAPPDHPGRPAGRRLPYQCGRHCHRKGSGGKAGGHAG